jgi:hypothetical protein
VEIWKHIEASQNEDLHVLLFCSHGGCLPNKSLIREHFIIIGMPGWTRDS